MELKLVATKKAMSMCFKFLDKVIAAIKTGKGFLSKSNLELLASAKWKGDKKEPARETVFTTIIPLTYFSIAHHVEEPLLPYCRKEVSGLVP